MHVDTHRAVIYNLGKLGETSNIIKNVTEKDERMDLNKLITQLRRERDYLEKLIMRIESLALGGEIPRGRPLGLPSKQKTAQIFLALTSQVQRKDVGCELESRALSPRLHH